MSSESGLLWSSSQWLNGTAKKDSSQLCFISEIAVAGRNTRILHAYAPQEQDDRCRAIWAILSPEAELNLRRPGGKWEIDHNQLQCLQDTWIGHVSWRSLLSGYQSASAISMIIEFFQSRLYMIEMWIGHMPLLLSGRRILQSFNPSTVNLWPLFTLEPCYSSPGPKVGREYAWVHL